MNISKSLVVCAVALLCLVSIPARGEDTPEQAKMREALRQKMAEEKVGGAVAPAPSTAPEPVPVAPAPVVAKPVKAAPTAKPVVPAPVVVAKPAPVAPTIENGLALAPGDDLEAARLRQVLRERMGQSTASAATTSTPSSNTGGVAPAPAVLESAPALPISGSKSERLAALLQQYKADQITPQQYHEQRAKILAE